MQSFFRTYLCGPTASIAIAAPSPIQSADRELQRVVPHPTAENRPWTIWSILGAFQRAIGAETECAESVDPFTQRFSYTTAYLPDQLTHLCCSWAFIEKALTIIL